MRFTKKQVQAIKMKHWSVTDSKRVSISIFFGIVFGMIISACYVLNADTVNTYWQKQYMKHAYLPDFTLKITKE